MKVINSFGSGSGVTVSASWLFIFLLNKRGQYKEIQSSKQILTYQMAISMHF